MNESDRAPFGLFVVLTVVVALLLVLTQVVDHDSFHLVVRAPARSIRLDATFDEGSFDDTSEELQSADNRSVVVLSASGLGQPDHIRFSIGFGRDNARVHFTVEGKGRDCSQAVHALGVTYWSHADESDRKTSSAMPVGCFVWDIQAVMPKDKVVWYFFLAPLSGLVQNSIYNYAIGQMSSVKGDLPQVRQLSWYVHKANSGFLILSDTGATGLEEVVHGAKEEEVLSVVHVGDQSYASDMGECYGWDRAQDAKIRNDPKCAYDCKFEECAGAERQFPPTLKRWRDFYKVTKGIMERYPLMTTPGNHDNDLTWFYKFRPPVSSSFPGVGLRDIPRVQWSLLRRLRTIKGPSSRIARSVNSVLREPYFYSYDDGRVHFVSVGTEDNPMNGYERNEGGKPTIVPRYQERYNKHFGQDSPQYRWLANDLATVDREKTPWLVVFMHRPFYQSSGHHKICTRDGDWYGCELRQLYGPLFDKYKVNLVISGHSHHYQRSKPLSFEKPHPVVSPGSAVYIVCGTGGYRLDKGFRTEKTELIEFRHGGSYGYCKLKPINTTHLLWTFVATKKEKGGQKYTNKALDSTYILNG